MIIIWYRICNKQADLQPFSQAFFQLEASLFTVSAEDFPFCQHVIVSFSGWVTFKHSFHHNHLRYLQFFIVIDVFSVKVKCVDGQKRTKKWWLPLISIVFISIHTKNKLQSQKLPFLLFWLWMQFYSLSDRNYNALWQPLQLSQWLASALHTAQHTGFRFNNFWQRVIPLDRAPQESSLPKKKKNLSPRLSDTTFIVALFYRGPLCDLFCLSRSNTWILSAKWISEIMRHHTSCILHHSMHISFPAGWNHLFPLWTFLHYLSPVLILQEHLHRQNIFLQQPLTC